MPFIVYIFTLSAFALGLAEFVPIGLADVIARDLGVNVEQAGGAVSLYALGATFAAPIFSALTAGWSRRHALLVTVLVFCAGSLVVAFANSLALLLVARFVAGMGHGLFLAVASSTAARLVGPGQAGRAVAVVFAGFTLAMAIGVPIGTYLGGLLSWRPVLGAIAAFGALGFLGLLLGMREPARVAGQQRESAGQALKAILHPALLTAALVTVLGYAGSFSAYTYIAPLLTEVTQISSTTVGLFMLAYGVLAAVGNWLGGRLTDGLGVNRASAIVLAGIAACTLGMWGLATFAGAMFVLVALLGLFTYAAVPALQARLIGVAERHAPHAQGVAAGLNIAGFNAGIALGAWLGGITIGQAGIAWMGLSGAIVAMLGLGLLGLLLVNSPDSGYRRVTTGE
ncbi:MULTISPECIES: MFS transporter [unclassified Pseudomonas]|uniref:MFS transporter n=1 Tax=unclassified Pseudomonas TaxID=196821 RepID=UPI0008393B37|nr:MULTISPECIES: MFS transporter [unclassified Pseudomonas]QIH08859.1 MFS transporter [Pseudomonas sp. BIOMIG1BAC]